MLDFPALHSCNLEEGNLNVASCDQYHGVFVILTNINFLVLTLLLGLIIAKESNWIENKIKCLRF